MQSRYFKDRTERKRDRRREKDSKKIESDRERQRERSTERQKTDLKIKIHNCFGAMNNAETFRERRV